MRAYLEQLHNVHRACREAGEDPSLNDAESKLPALVLSEPAESPGDSQLKLGMALDAASPPALQSLKVTPILKSIKQAVSLKDMADTSTCPLELGPTSVGEAHDAGGGSRCCGANEAESAHKKNDISALLN